MIACVCACGFADDGGGERPRRRPATRATTVNNTCNRFIKWKQQRQRRTHTHERVGPSAERRNIEQFIIIMIIDKTDDRRPRHCTVGVVSVRHPISNSSGWRLIAPLRVNANAFICLCARCLLATINTSAHF